MQYLRCAREVLQTSAFEKDLQAISVHRRSIRYHATLLKIFISRLKNSIGQAPPPESKKFVFGSKRNISEGGAQRHASDRFGFAFPAAQRGLRHRAEIRE